MKTYYVYIMANKSRTLYTGVTNNLERRVLAHRRQRVPGFTTRYNINRPTFGEARSAIHREKQIKGWLRTRRVALIESAHRDWKDLSDGWYGKDSGLSPRAPRKRALTARFFASPCTIGCGASLRMTPGWLLKYRDSRARL